MLIFLGQGRRGVRRTQKPELHGFPEVGPRGTAARASLAQKGSNGAAPKRRGRPARAEPAGLGAGRAPPGTQCAGHDAEPARCANLGRAQSPRGHPAARPGGRGPPSAPALSHPPGARPLSALCGAPRGPRRARGRSPPGHQPWGRAQTWPRVRLRLPGRCSCPLHTGSRLSKTIFKNLKTILRLTVTARARVT